MLETFGVCWISLSFIRALSIADSGQASAQLMLFLSIFFRLQGLLRVSKSCDCNRDGWVACCLFQGVEAELYSKSGLKGFL